MAHTSLLYMALSSSGQDTTLSRWRTRDRNPVVSPAALCSKEERCCNIVCLRAEARPYGWLSGGRRLHMPVQLNWLEHSVHTRAVGGSTPPAGTINKNLTFKKIFVIIYMLKKYKRKKLYIAMVEQWQLTRFIPQRRRSNRTIATKDFNILLLFLSVYKDPQSEILDGRVVAKLWVNIGSNIF